MSNWLFGFVVLTITLLTASSVWLNLERMRLTKAVETAETPAKGAVVEEQKEKPPRFAATGEQLRWYETGDYCDTQVMPWHLVPDEGKERVREAWRIDDRRLYDLDTTHGFNSSNDPILRGQVRKALRELCAEFPYIEPEGKPSSLEALRELEKLGEEMAAYTAKVKEEGTE